jgi:hypothetical protein
MSTVIALATLAILTDLCYEQRTSLQSCPGALRSQVVVLQRLLVDVGAQRLAGSQLADNRRHTFRSQHRGDPGRETLRAAGTRKRSDRALQTG